MITLTHEALKAHTLMRCGGVCETMLIPDSERELLECLASHPGSRILGAGSNILPADAVLKGTIIKNTRACLDIEYDGRRVLAGSSVGLAKLVRFLVSQSLFGYEYLVSVPGSVGGAVCMNAGRGRSTGTSISDYLTRVKLWNGREVQWLDKNACDFGYRQSIFRRRPSWVILGAEFEVPAQPAEIGLVRMRERLAEVRNKQDRAHPNLGTVFSRVSPRAASKMLGIRRGDAAFSAKTPNWLVNLGNARTRDFLYLINLMRVRSLVFGVIPHLEITIWK